MIDLPALDNLVRQADPTSTDADLAARLSVAIKTPQDVRVPGYRVTAATLASVWGFARATTFQATLRGAIAAGQAADASQQAKAFGAACDLALSVLTGPGLKCSDRESEAAAAQFVAVGFCTAAEVDGVFFDVSYPAGDVVTAADVTASRARVADQDKRAKVVTALASVLNDWLGQQPTAPSAAAVTQQVQAALAQAGVQ